MIAQESQALFIRLPKKTHRLLKMYAAEADKSMTQVIEELIDLQIAEREKELARK